jgi:hypothetical protein
MIHTLRRAASSHPRGQYSTAGAVAHLRSRVDHLHGTSLLHVG